jgi:3' exoribonuclease family, domain 1
LLPLELSNKLAMLRRLVSPGSSFGILAGSRRQLKQALDHRGLCIVSPSFQKVLGASSAVPNSKLVFYDGGSMGHLAESSAVCSQGGSLVHATVCSARNTDPQDDSLPLSVDYRSRAYAFGRIPKSVNKRERHGTDEETLVARFVDRAIRPLFPKGYVNEVQVTVTAHATG